MAEFIGQLARAFSQTSPIEMAAVALAVAYLLLAIAQRIECWAAAFVSSCLYVWIFFRAHLYMESGLNGFYALMAAYGFRQWQHGKGGGALPVSRWPLDRHLMALAAVVVLSLISAYPLRRFTPAAWPFVDSMVTWSSVFATFLVARKVYENWHWWLVIDSIGAYLYFTRRLYATMMLYALYVLLIIVGMRRWRHSLSKHALA